MCKKIKNNLQAQEVREDSSKMMNEKAKEARRAYRREWARKNRDKVMAAQERYWNKKAAANDPAHEDPQPVTKE